MTQRLKTKIDALGQDLAEVDPRTRAAMMARLERAVGQRLRAVPNRSSDRVDETAEDQFDNLPV